MGISKDLTEEDIKFRYINEAITSKGWSKDSIFRNYKWYFISYVQTLFAYLLIILVIVTTEDNSIVEGRLL